MTLEHAPSRPRAEDQPAVAPGRLSALLSSRWAAGLALGGLLVLHAVVQLAVRPYPRWGDAMLTFGYARDFPDVPADHHSTRLGVLLPARLLQEIFGWGQVSFHIYPVLMGVVLVVATFFLARTMFGLVAAVVAGFLIIWSPLLVRTVGNTTSWQLLPDVPAAAWLTSAVALLMAAAVRLQGTPSEKESRRPLLLLVVSGLCFGLAYTCREFVASVFVVIPLVFYLYKIAWRRLVVIALPMLGVLVVETLIMWAVWGDPLTRFTAVGGHGAEPPQVVSRLDNLMKMPDAFAAQSRGTVTVLMMALTVAGAVVLARRNLVIAAAWGVSFALPLLLLGGVIVPDFVSLRLQLTRYWVPLMPAIVIGAVGTVSALYAAIAGGRDPASRRRLAIRGTAVLALFALWYPLPMARYAYGNPNDRAWNGLRAFLSANDERISRISTDYRSGDELMMYRYRPIGGEQVWGGDVNVINELDELKRYNLLDEVPPPSAVGGGELLVTSETARQRPRPRDGWVLAWRQGGVRLYTEEGSDLARNAVGGGVQR